MLASFTKLSSDQSLTSMLDLRWDSAADELLSQVDLLSSTSHSTKHQTLSEVARLFDPVDFIPA